MAEETLPTNRPPEGEIPDILEWKLDVIMAQLARMGGGQPSEHNPPVGRTRERLPNVDEFDPVKDPFPSGSGIPEILEWKLELMIRALGQIAAVLIAPGVNVNLGPIQLLLFLILLALNLLGVLLGIIAGLLAGISALLTGILVLLAFIVIQVVVPQFILGRRRP